MPVPTESGVSVISIGMLKPRRDQVVAWRGPMLDRALVQMLSDCYWGDLDVLLLDLPPGTGDVAISLGQHLPNAEVVVVTTPQEAAAEVAERAGTMASMMHQRVVGVVENMSYLPCPHCAGRVRPPARGVRLGRWRAGRRDARRSGSATTCPLLGEVPLDIALREGGDLRHARSSSRPRPRPPPSCCSRSPTRWPGAVAASPGCSSGSPPPGGSSSVSRTCSGVGAAGARRHRAGGGARLRPRQAPRLRPSGRPDGPPGPQFAAPARDDIRERARPGVRRLRADATSTRAPCIRKHLIEAMDDAEDDAKPKRKGLRRRSRTASSRRTTSRPPSTPPAPDAARRRRPTPAGANSR